MGLTRSPAFSTPLCVFIFLIDVFIFIKKMKETTYVRQQGPDCVVSHDGKRHVVKDCNANKLGNTLWNRLGPKYTNQEMYKFGFIPEMYKPRQNCRYA